MRRASLASLALAALLAALAGCASEPGPPADAEGTGAPPADPGEARTSRAGADPEFAAAVLYHGARDVVVAAFPEDASFEVPAGARAVTVALFANGTADCWLGYGEDARPQNPTVPLVAPSGAVQALVSSVVGGCRATGGASYLDGMEIGDAEAGTWTVQHGWRGHGVRVEVIVAAEVPVPPAAA